MKLIPPTMNPPSAVGTPRFGRPAVPWDEARWPGRAGPRVPACLCGVAVPEWRWRAFTPGRPTGEGTLSLGELK